MTRRLPLCVILLCSTALFLPPANPQELSADSPWREVPATEKGPAAVAAAAPARLYQADANRLDALLRQAPLELSGAAPALTTNVLGVRPTSPGFATFVVTPHPGDLEWARGDVPTPHGTIHVSWKLAAGRAVVSVSAPRATAWTNRPAKTKKAKA